MPLSCHAQMMINALYTRFIETALPMHHSSSELESAIINYGAASDAEDKKNTAVKLCLHYFNAPFFPEWLLEVLEDFSKSPLMLVLNSLNKQGLLMESEGEAYLKIILSHTHLISLHNALAMMERANLLGGEQGRANCIDLLLHANPEALVSAFVTLKGRDILEHALYRKLVVAHEHPDAVAAAFWPLELSDIHHEAQRIAVLTHSQPNIIATVLSSLRGRAFLSNAQGDSYFNAILAHPDPERFGRALSILNVAKVLERSPEDDVFIIALLNHLSAEEMAITLSVMKSYNLLEGYRSKINGPAILAHKSPIIVAHALYALAKAGLLEEGSEQQYFTALIKHSDVLCTAAMKPLWVGIARHHLTQVEFYTVLAICQNDAISDEERQKEVIRYIHSKIFGIIEIGCKPAYRFFKEEMPEVTTQPLLTGGPDL